MDSILLSVKKYVGIHEDDDSFDSEIAQDINSVFFTLYQLGIGPSIPFEIEHEGTCWSDFLISKKYISATKQYICKKVKIAFDPPTNSTLLMALQESVKELEWRLLCERENNQNVGE